jgi:rhamnosyltransferase subunit B
MKILIMAIGSYGDVLPLLGLAKVLRRRSFDVTFFTNGHFADLIRQTGLDFVPLDSAEAYDTFADNPALWHPHKGWRLIMKQLASSNLQKTYRILCRHVTSTATILVSSTLGVAARLVQETHGIPHATIHLSPGVFHSAHSPPKMANLPLPAWLPIWFKRGCWSVINQTMIDPLIKPYLNAFRQDLGLSPVSSIFQRWLHSPDLVIGMFPDWFASPQCDWPRHTTLTGFPLYDESHDAALPQSVHTFLQAHPQPLVFTPGSANKHGQRFFAEAAKACGLLKKPGIFLTRYPEQLPALLPESIRHFSYVPLSRLLPRCAAIIHHGGIGTCSQALRAGIPQLIQPLAFDQFDNAHRIRTLEAGGIITTRSFRSRTLANRLPALLFSSNIQEACRRLARRLNQTDGLASACEAIESRLIDQKNRVHDLMNFAGPW